MPGILRTGEPRRVAGPTHAFTVDVEDWAHGIPIDSAARERLPDRLERGMDRLLAQLAARDVRATFFLLGPVVRRHPALARRLAEAGHELGCHGWSHDLIYSMTPERFRAETRDALETIREASGVTVRAYRAAYFSITRRSLWALDILAELGFKYDSSIFPVRNWRYGIPDWEPEPTRIDTPNGTLYEFPITVRPLLGRRIPVGGGAYFRLYPFAVTAANFRWAERAGRPVVFYLHPWELDPNHPRIPFHWRARLTHYANLRSTEPKLARLLADFRFGPLGEVLDREFA